MDRNIIRGKVERKAGRSQGGKRSPRSLGEGDTGFPLIDTGLNIGAYTEAAEHFLSALAMQDSSGGTKSEQVWFTLRRTFMSMVRIWSTSFLVPRAFRLELDR